MKPTALKLVLSTSLILLAISACTHDPIKAAIPAAANVTYDHSQRAKINKQKYINQYQQAYIRTQNNTKRQNTATYRKQAANQSAIRPANYNPAGQQASYQKVAYNPQRKLKNTWQQVHQGYKLGNYNHQPKVRRYVKSYARMPKRMTTLSHRSSPYLPTIIAEVNRRGMPTEIALLPFVESAFNTKAYSPAHAAGLWQFIPGTARRYGLPVSKRYDARYNFKLSTNAALSYLQDLNKQFKGDWLLSLAAYNCGEARVHREIAKNRKLGRPTDFWHLRLPKETRNYVPRLLAFKEVYGNPRAYGIPIAYIPSNPKYGRVRYTPPSKNRVAKKYKKKSKYKTSKRNKKIITHRVRSGETLYRIAKKYRTSVRKIMRINGLKSTKIRVGKRLKVATTKRRSYG
ncbi:MAG: transglycosylase SLT domain-containing protein [Thiotrichaceae bacterium]